MGNIFILISNTLKVTFRKKGNIFIYIFLPVIGLLLSMAIYGNVGNRPLNVGIADKDGSAISKDFANVLAEGGKYQLSAIDEDEIKEKVLSSSVDTVIIIPEGYGESVYTGNIRNMEVISLKGQESTAWMENFININSQNLLSLSTAAEGDKAAFDKMYENYRKSLVKLSVEKVNDQKTSKSVTVSSMGFLIMFIMLGSSFTSQLILNDKRLRTYNRICSAPVSSREYLASNAITSLFIVSLQIIVIQLAMKYVFRIETYVPDLLMFLMLLLFGMVAIGIGMLITAFSSSSYMASTLSSLIMTPTCMLGGCFWPIEFMPEIMKKIAFFMPQWWTLDAIKKIQLGSGIDTVVMNMVILLAFGAALLLIAVYKFSRAGSVQKFV